MVNAVLFDRLRGTMLSKIISQMIIGIMTALKVYV